MDHVWNSLHQWEIIWEERIEAEKKKPDYDQGYIDALTKELKAIQKAMKEIHKCM
jgi:hypothetical protein